MPPQCLWNHPQLRITESSFNQLKTLLKVFIKRTKFSLWVTQQSQGICCLEWSCWKQLFWNPSQRSGSMQSLCYRKFPSWALIFMPEQQPCIFSPHLAHLRTMSTKERTGMLCKFSRGDEYLNSSTTMGHVWPAPLKGMMSRHANLP